MARRKIERSVIVAVNAKVTEMVAEWGQQELVDYIMDNVPIKKLEELLYE